MGKRLSQLNQIEEVKKEDYLLVDSEEYLESKKIKLEKIDINSFDTKNFYNEINRIFVKKEQNKGLSSNDFTDKDKNKLDNSQEKLKSGINIKNINGESILGEGNIDIQGGKDDIYNNFSNSLKSTKSGAVIAADDVSPLEHSLKVKLTSDTVTDFSGVSVTRKGMNFFNPAENFDASYKDYVSLDDDVFTMSTPQAQLYINTDKTVVTPAGKYTITLFPLEDYSDFNVFVYFYNKDGGETSVSTGTIGTAFGTYSYTFTAYEDFILSIGGAYGHLYSGERKFRVMLEEGAVDNSKYSVFVEPQTVAANKYGTVEGLTSASPMTLYSDNDEVIIHCEYNKDINSFKGGAAAEVDQVYDPVSSNAQSGKAVNGAIKEVQANTNNQISQLDKKINTIASTGLTRQIVEVLPEATPETSTTTIYMVPDEEATENNAYKEYLFCKTWSFIDSGTTYVYGLEIDGENLSGVALPDITSGLITDMDTFSSDNDRPIYRKVTLVGDRFGENSTITVTDTAFGFIGEAALIALHESKNTALDFFPSETWEEVLEDDEMYAYGYRHKISCYVQVYREATVPELIGSTKVDLTDYYTKSEIDEQIGDIDSALDELHAYAQTLVSGGATE